MEKKKENINNIKTEESFSSESEEVTKPNFKIKSMTNNYFGKNKNKKLDEDKFFVYKKMEDLNNLEQKFNIGRDEKKMSSQKLSAKKCQ